MALEVGGGGALDLTLELEISEGIQQQLWAECRKDQVVALRAKLREVSKVNRHLVEDHLKYERRIQCLKDNYGRFMAFWERERLRSGVSQ